MKTAIITGATRGIGKAIALKLAQMGYSLGLCARSESDLEDLKLLLEENKTISDQLFVMQQVDAVSKQQIKHFADLLNVKFQSIDIIVNNVGSYQTGYSLTASDDQFESQMAVNLYAAYFLTKALSVQMIKQGEGHIFNICSVASLSPVVEAGSYSVTKAGMLSLNHVWRKELAPLGIKVTAIIPGATYTSSWAESSVDSSALIQASDIADSIAAVLQLSKNANVDEIKISPLNF